ncbi:MAG TPA: zinc-binding dehydrogenase [Steroidobacteraceae bacterium]|nr:zinc-binding dehydrogenase [Steroidobacteraceae bacterium]
MSTDETRRQDTDGETDHPGAAAEAGRQPASGVTRRGLLKNSLAVAGSVAAMAAGTASARADDSRPYSPLYAQTGDSVGGRKFRAWVSRGDGPKRTTLHELTMRPIGGRQVVVRTEAANLCYTLSQPMLGIVRSFGSRSRPLTAQQRARNDQINNMAIIQGHGGVGIVEAIGPEVRRVKVGDRVCVSGTPQCGVCYACVRGRSDMCQFLGPANTPEGMTPIADMRDGTPVYMNSQIGGFGEYMISVEEWVVPVMSKAPAAHLEVACACTSVAGLGATTSQGIAVLPPSAKVAVVGSGPLGLSAIQGARIAGARMIIAIDPIRVRREAALKVGATHVLDPNEPGDVVEKVRQLTSEDNPSMWGGGIYSGPFQAGGADFVVEAAGGEWLPPALERGPDPTGLLPMEQAYEMLHGTGHAVLTSLAFGDLSFNAGSFALAGRSVHAGQAGGCSPLRDIPKFVSFLDNGSFDPKPMLTAPTPLEKVLDTYQEVARRATILAVLVV